MTTLAAVTLWGRRIGAVAMEEADDYATFQYDHDFARSRIEVSPVVMPLSDRIYRFPELAHASFHGLPGLLADSLPDTFGNALIDAWLATLGRTPDTFNAVERLCYTGARGMGALEFEPATGPAPARSQPVEIDALVELASAVLQQRADLAGSFAGDGAGAALTDILRVGTSAGGARAKAVIAWHPETNDVRSGQVDAGDGYEYWLLKFDGVAGNRDRELDDPQGYGAIEYAYSLMATDAGITMQPCRLLEEGERRHFMTQRFDRRDGGGKLHMQTLAGLGHYDFNLAGAYGYEQALMMIRRLGLSMDAIEEQYRRMAFNIIARNHDDHVKNIAFLMDKRGRWSLSPAYDMTYSFNPNGVWTSRHQMTMNGKRDDFTDDDFKACARSASMQRGRAETIVGEVCDVVAGWPAYADRAGVKPGQRDKITQTLRL